MLFTQNTYCDILLIGGGGGGGGCGPDARAGGGGGAGQVVYIKNQYIPSGTLMNINVGHGGKGGDPGQSSTHIAFYGQNGGNSVISYGTTTITAKGGGGGAYGQAATTIAGLNGASGGGGVGNTTLDGTGGTADSSGITGYAGGIGGNNWGGGGGGGFGGIGGSPTSGTGGNGGDGGIGISNDITGTNILYAGGGGGGGYNGVVSSTSYTKVGGNSTFRGGRGGGYGVIIGTSYLSYDGEDAVSNSGSGGGGSTASSNGGGRRGGNGGSGIVIIRYSIVPASILNNTYYLSFTDTSRPYTLIAPQDITCDILVVGGGGAGGIRSGGGGGAGACIYLTNQILKQGIYNVIVGSGSTLQNANGFDSYIQDMRNGYIDIFRAKGGGCGGVTSTTVGKSGGSSGGNRGENTALSNDIVTSTNVPQGRYGNRGGSGSGVGGENVFGGGGGGGAGSIGGNSTTSGNATAGSGGSGLLINITGVDRYYAAGGGGGCASTANAAGIGGSGIGGNGSKGAVAAGNGVANTGSGGGGSGFVGSTNGTHGAGGSGIIIIRYTVPNDKNIRIMRKNNNISFEINSTSVLLLPYKNNVWNTITWNISKSGSTNAFIKVNNENAQYYTRIPLSSGIYTNKLETSYNKVTNFNIDTSPLTITSYIIESSNHVYYKFDSSTNLLSDSSIYNRNLINNGGVYVNDMSRDSLLLIKGSSASFATENWSTCNNLTISMWMKTTSMSNLDKILNFEASAIQNFSPNQYKIQLLNQVINDYNLTDYQIKVSIPYYADFRTDFQDIRILSTDNSVLNHYIENVQIGVSADVWVKIPIYTNNVILSVTYGNSPSTGDANSVFDLYDTFSTLDTTKWRLSTEWDSTNIQPMVQDGYLKLTRDLDYQITTDESGNTTQTLLRGPNTVLSGIDSKNVFALSNYVIELKTCASASNVSDNPSASIIFRADISNNYGLGIQYNTAGTGTNGMGVVFNNPYSNMNTTTLSFPNTGQAFPKFNTLVPTNSDWKYIRTEILDNTISLWYNNALIHRYNFGSTYAYNGPGRVGIYSRGAGNVFIDELKVYKSTSNITSNIFYQVKHTPVYNNIQIASDMGMMSFLINNTPIYKTYIKDNMWNHILWNVKSNNSTSGFIRINNGTRYTFDEVPIVSNQYVNTLGSVANISNLYLSDFRIYTGDLSNDIEDNLFKYSLKNNKHLHYTFKSPQLLTDDDSGNNRHFINNNNGAIYERNNNINSILLKSSSNILLPTDNWSLYEYVTLSGMFKMSSISVTSNILLDFSFPYKYDVDVDNISSNLVARYTFENNFNDTSGNNYHLTTTSSPTFDFTNKVEGNSSAYFDANNFVGNTNISMSNRSFTICFWMKPYNFNSTIDYWILTQGTVLATRQLLLLVLLTSNRLRFGFYNDDVDTPVYNTNQLNQWFHITLTYDKENNREMRIYKDGILCARKNAGGDTNFDNSFRIGRPANVAANYYGNIDDFRIYNKVLAADMIYKIYKYSETKYANIKLLQRYDRLTFQINDKTVNNFLINNNIWYHITWNINKQSSRSFIQINDNKLLYDTPILLSGTYTNKLGSTSNLGNIYISDFKILTVPITKEIEDELYDLSSYEYGKYMDYNNVQIHSNQIMVKNYNYDLTDIYAHYKFETQQFLSVDSSRNARNLNNFGGIYTYDYGRNNVFLKNGELLMNNENWYNHENLSLSFWYKTNNFKYGDTILDFRPNPMLQFTMRFPRQPVTNYTLTYNDGSGIQVRVAESSRASTTDHYGFRLFNNNLYTDTNGWASLDKYSASASGIALNTMNYFATHKSFYGEWIMIDLGEAIYLERYRIYPLNSSTQRSPQDFRIYATNDETAWSYPQSLTWILLDEELNITGYENNNFKEFYVANISQAYRYFAIIINRTQGGTGSQSVQFTEWELFGRPVVEHPIYISTSNIAPVRIGDTDDYYVSFTNTTYPHYISFNQDMKCDILLVGGGGGGGARHGGGGGAGGFVYQQNVTFAANTLYTITVGAGGTGGNTSFYTANNGRFSRIQGTNFDMIAYGGGGGGGSGTAESRKGDAISDPFGVNGITNSTNYLDAFGNLGSGGGTGGDASSGAAGSLTTFGNIIAKGVGGNINGYSFGNNGGTGKTYNGGNWIGAGGGGAGTAGESNTTSSSPADTTAGKGGDGKSCDITGTSVIYAGGGGGGANIGLTAGAGGTGGGGAGSVGTNTANNGTPGTGGGGGGSGFNSSSNGVAGNGGSGIVIIRYMLPRNTKVKPNFTITNTPNGMHFNVNKNTVFVDNNYIDNTWNHVLWNIKDKKNIGFIRINNGVKNEYNFIDKMTVTSEFPREPLVSNTFMYYDFANIQVRVLESSGVDAYKLFNNIFYSASNGWSSDTGKYTGGFATSATNFFNNDTGYNGEWIMIDLGESIILEKYRIYPYNDNLKRTPRDFRIYATNDNGSWNNTKSGKWFILDEENSIIDYANNTYKEFNVFVTERYRYYAILINKTQYDNDTTTVQLSEFTLYGRTEYNISDNAHTFINKIGNAMNQGSIYISDFMVITRPLDYDLENSLYNAIFNESEILNVDTLQNNLLNINSLYYNTSKRLDTTTNGVIAYGNVTVTGNLVSNYSDMRLKNVVGEIREPLETILKLNTFKYTANEIAKSVCFDDDKIQVGLSAQEVNEVLPELVQLAPIDTEYMENGVNISKSGANYLTLSYEGLIPVLIESVKILRQKITSLSTRKKH
jgi:hypothetical protein